MKNFTENESDALVNVIAKNLGDNKISSMNELKEEFVKLKDMAYFNLFVRNNVNLNFHINNSLEHFELFDWNYSISGKEVLIW